MKTPKAFLFDVFGTVVNWRLTLTQGLAAHAEKAIKAGTASPSAQETVSQMTPTHWEALAVEWHRMYIEFSAGFMAGVSEWVDNDTVHRRTLAVLVERHRLGGLWTESEMQQVGLLWQELEAWPDSAAGVDALNRLGAVTSTLSNASGTLLRRCCIERNAIPFAKTLCSDDFHAYKPAPEVYRGAARRVMDGTPDEGKVEPGEIAMVAAHLPDLQFAKRNGLMTIYVERPLEEALSRQEAARIKAEGRDVDMWIEEGLGGFKEIVRRLSADQ